MILQFVRFSVIAFASLLLASCATRPQFAAGTACETSVIRVTDQFAGARRGTCTVLSPNRVRLEIRPENPPPINDSPWYAFRLEPKVATSVHVTLAYVDGHHRYWPKQSTDGVVWSRLDTARVEEKKNGRSAKLEVVLNDEPVYIAAQELVLPSLFDEWSDELAKRNDVSKTTLGESSRGRPIFVLDANSQNRDTLLIVGRQHPPEITGSIAFMAFAETVFGSSELAKRFREQFRVVGVPFLNPDGVVAGHWRNGPGGVDLNRDWGPFTQPETQLIEGLLADLDDAGARIRVFLDFHSTQRNVFYTQNDEFVTDPPGFMPAWLANAKARIQNYDFQNQPGPVGEQANSKNYMYKRYGIPTATYEVGDETDRTATRDAAQIFAEELMKLMLLQDY